MKKSSIAILCLFLSCLLGVGVFAYSSGNNDDCILKGMQGVSSNSAATSITKACRSKYPEKAVTIDDFELSSSQLSKLNLVGSISESSGHPFYGDLYNGNSDIKITSITVQINNSESHKYLAETQADPLTAKFVHFDVHNLNSLNTHSIISARGILVKTH